MAHNRTFNCRQSIVLKGDGINHKIIINIQDLGWRHGMDLSFMAGEPHQVKFIINII